MPIEIKIRSRIYNMIKQDFKNNVENVEYHKRNAIGFVDLNEYKSLVMAALLESANHQLLGSIGDQDALKLYQRLKYEDYCISHNMTYEEMDYDDFENCYEEEAFQREKDLAMSYDL